MWCVGQPWPRACCPSSAAAPTLRVQGGFIASTVGLAGAALFPAHQLLVLLLQVHATFQFSGTPGKRHRMRERLWWNVRLAVPARVAHVCRCLGNELAERSPSAVVISCTHHVPFFPSLCAVQDPPAYFTHEHGFLVHDDPVPQALLDAARTVTRDFTLQVLELVCCHGLAGGGPRPLAGRGRGCDFCLIQSSPAAMLLRHCWMAQCHPHQTSLACRPPCRPRCLTLSWSTTSCGSCAYCLRWHRWV